jgi:hypothetical protein
VFYKFAYWIFWSVVAICGCIIALRAFIGPLPMHINSPMNAESCFGLAVILMLVSRAIPVREIQELHPDFNRQDILLAAVLALITTAVFWRTTDLYFLSDDFILLKYANAPIPKSFHDLFGFPGGDGFFRPIGNISLALNSRWASSDPVLWHLSALALHAANSILVFVLARLICSSRSAAFFAATLFALHGTRCWLVSFRATAPNQFSPNNFLNLAQNWHSILQRYRLRNC